MIFVACLSVPAHAAASFVKSAGADSYNTTVNVTFGSNVTAGNVLAVLVGWYPKTTLNSVTATCASGGFTQLDSPTTGSYSRAALAYAVVSTSGPCTVTATAASGTNFIGALVHEISGVDTTTPLDNNQHRINIQVSPLPGTGANAVTSGPITTTQSGDYIFGATFNESLNRPTISAGTGFTVRQNEPANVMRSEDLIQGTPGAIAATFTNNSAYSTYLTGIMAFRPSGGGPPDTTPPTVSLTAPANGAVVGGTAVTVSATASDNVAVAGVQFLLDGVNLQAEDTTVPYSITWDTTTASPGTHVLSARARDLTGNTATAANVTVTVDNQPPTGTIVINGGAAATNSLNVTLTLSATDALSTVTQMRFSNTGSSYSAAETYATTKAWTLSTGTGTKTVYVQFKDAVGNWSAAFTDTIVYDNTAPTISAVSVSNSTDTSATVSWTTNEPATSQVEYGTTTSYGQATTLDTNLVTSHVVSLTGLSPQTTYNSRVRSTDAAANLSLGSNATFATLATPDTTPPTTPANVSATVVSPTQIAISWDASTDDVGVTGYNVYRNNVQVGTPATTSFLDTGVARATTYSYEVEARDAGGNVSPRSAVVTATTPALIISNVQSSSITMTGAVITWTTDAPATSGVDYGTTTAYGLTTENPTLTLNHSRTLTGLSQNTRYHFRVTSADGNNNRVTSDDFVFTTPFGSQGGIFQDDVLITGMNLPTNITFLPNGDLLVLELGGTIWRVPSGTTQIAPVPFLQLTNVGSAGVQQGLMAMTLDPDFATNHFYYVFYTLGAPNQDRASRFTANADFSGTVAGSERVLYQDPQDAGVDHHGGALNFGSDGKLYITTGDHFDANAAQLLTSPRGKILRINSDGTIPLDNPFYDGVGPNIDAIWALGLRNPSRASIDPATGRFFIGDGGGIDPALSQEEINLGVGGANYGWATCEGDSCSGNPAYTNPLYFYPHNGRDAAVTGGFVYHGNQFPAAFEGSYFFADYAQNWIRRLTFDANGTVNGVFNFEPTDGTLDGPLGDIIALAEGPDGSVYYVDQGYTDGIGKIHRIRLIGIDQPPNAVASANVSSGPAPLTVTFSSAGSSDPEGSTLTYLWAFGDGQTSTAANPVHTFNQTGVYQVQLSVSDGMSTTSAAPVAIVVGNPPVPVILTPSNGALFRAGDIINLSGSGTDPEEGSLPASAFTWNVDFLRDGNVEPITVFTGVTSGTFPIPTSGRDFSGNTRYRITLTVKDSTGMQNSTAVLIYPDKVNLTFDTVPTGLSINIDAVPHATPFVYDTLIGFNHTLNAIDQSQGSTNYTFQSWSDAGAQQHGIVVPSSNRSYVATYTGSQTSGPVITLDGNVHGSKDNDTTSSATVVVGPIGTPTAGDTIVCEFVFDYQSTFTRVADNVNSGEYLPAVYLHTDWDLRKVYGIYYKENVAAANTTITLTYGPANTHGAMSCQAWKGMAPAFTLDSTFLQSREGSTAQPSTGASLTPFGDGRLVISALGTLGVTPTAGAGFTMIDSNVKTKLFPEYQIQTTKTATTGDYNAAADKWYDQMAAFAPSTGGYCDVAAVMDWTGGVNGATVTAAALDASTKGGRKQPSSDVRTGWSLNGSATGMTFATTAYQPLVTSLSCPFYAGTGAGTLGIKYSTTQAAHSAQYNFQTSSPKASAGVCFSTDLPDNDAGGPNDVFTIYANTGTGVLDFANVVIWGNDGLQLYMETADGNSPESVPILSGHKYWLSVQYVKGGTHNIKVYDGCGASPPLLGTVTYPAIANGSLPNYLIIGSAGALTVTTGKNFFYGSIKLDFVYGKHLLP